MSENITFRRLEETDDVTQIAEWIYSTDTFLFNKLFRNKQKSIKALESLICSDYINPYNKRCMLLATNNRNIVLGVVLSYKGSELPYRDTIDAYRETELTNTFRIIENIILGRFLATNIKDNDYYVGNLYVNSEYRENNIGSKLLDECKSLARVSNSERVLLDVEYDKPYLLKFYKKNNFNKTSNNYVKIFKKVYGCYGLSYDLK